MASNYESIKNLLKRFKYNKNMSDEDYETTVRDILWNVKRIENESNNWTNSLDFGCNQFKAKENKWVILECFYLWR